MTDDEFITEFTRLAERDGKTVLEVGVVTWNGPYHPALSWKVFRRWSKCPTNEQLAAAQMKSLETPRFFRVCGHCKERVNAGHMLGQDICQSCAEKDLGITF
ncbi:conserved hypothetical protein (plasmid) [Nitrosococcus halophilus Nc 4]|uniref:Uncharacterized protein n=1 Tax=Nitrosococcus halophilus (strain Nc4) TaxID=472759 RepID=D5C5G2_NITHN|nr:hypothetical protein [Nitrosococcus halophilus]ADE17016.1 conserved hypothetical protein [Nitrosococcus halophilus Nc 4]